MKAKTLIKDDVWNNFVDTGKIPKINLVYIGKKIILGEKLDDRETSIYQNFSKEIEYIIKSFQMLDEL